MQESLNCRITGNLSSGGVNRATPGSASARVLFASLALTAGAAAAQVVAQVAEPLAYEFEAAQQLTSEGESTAAREFTAILEVDDFVDADPQQEVEDQLGLAPRLHVEIGRSPTRAAFALDISGGAPHGWALLHLRGDGGRCSTQFVRLDDGGAARVLRLDHRASGSTEVLCTIATPAGGSGLLTTRVLSAQVPSAPAMIAQSRALVGYGAPSSPFAALGSASGIVITEIMKDPTAVADTAGEWFEVRNLGSTPVDVSGWRIRDAGSNNHLIPATAGVVIPPRSYFVFGINATPALNGGVNVGYKYSGFTLGNGADDIQLYDAAGLLVDAVAYDAGVLWPSTPGKALNLNRALVDTTSNDDGANWCNALTPLNGGTVDTGTPRLANNVCP